MDTKFDKERNEIFRSQGLDRFEGITPDDLFDEFYSPRSDVQLAKNPERIAMMKEMIAGLSAEAKEVLRVVFDVPSELAEHIRGSGARMSQASIRDYLRYYDWSFSDIGRAFREIGNFLKNF